MADIMRERHLYGDWHHGNGALVCGTLRIASMDFDTSPSDKVKTEIFDWICERLNASPPAVATHAKMEVVVDTGDGIFHSTHVIHAQMINGQWRVQVKLGIEDQPPQTNEYVAPGCELFTSSAHAEPVSVPDGYVIVPIEPTDALLMSMSVRYDHGLGLPGYYDDLPIQLGQTHAQRLEGTKRTMRQLHEEVVGEGFHKVAQPVATQSQEKVDAERYRFIRDTHQWYEDYLTGKSTLTISSNYYSLDEAIDAAIADLTPALSHTEEE